MNTPKIIELHNQRLLTTEQLADFYEATERQIKQNFNNNKDKFIEGKHYYRLEGQELKNFKSQVEIFDLPINKFASQLILYTKQGASRHSKMLGTDRAWDMYDELEENYFNPKQQMQIPNTPRGLARLALAASEETNQRVDELEIDIETLKTETILNASQRRKINGMVKSTVVKVLGGLKSNAYKDKSIRGKCFSNCNKQLRDYFDVSSYMDIPKIRFEEAMELIPKWQPTLELQAHIETVNGQSGVFEGFY